MFEICVKGKIAAAHFLRGYEGKCKNLHGHTWKVEVFLSSQKLDAIGMVADFAVLKKQLKEFLMSVDHLCLNDLAFFKDVNPTTENIAKYVYENFSKVVLPLKVTKVGVWESDTAGVVYFD